MFILKNVIFYIIIVIIAILYAFCCEMEQRMIVGGSKPETKPLFRFFKKGKPSHEQRAREAFEAVRNKKNNPVALTVEDIADSIQYEALGQTRLGNHFGQRKLGLSEIQFLNEWSKISDEPVYCVYAGAAPSNKTHILVDLFPNVKLILVDPNKFEIMVPGEKGVVSHRTVDSNNLDILHFISGYPTKSKEFAGAKTRKINTLTDDDMDAIASFINNDKKNKIYIFEDYFDVSGEKVASLLSRLNRKIIFVSDIRSNVENNEFPSDLDIIWNTAMMFNWIKSIRPEYSMIKFRLPFFNETRMQDKWTEFRETFDVAKANGIDFVEDNIKKSFRMFGGKSFLQVWPGRSSTELRLHTRKNEIDMVVEYDIGMIEAKLNYYNIMYRTLVCHTNQNSNKKIGLCLCNDCAIENTIWMDYIAISGNKKPVSYFISMMDELSRQPLWRRHEHQIYAPLSDSEVIKLIDFAEKASAKSVEKGRQNKFGKQRGNSGKAL